VVAHRSGVIAHVVVAAVSFTVFLVADKVGCEQWSALPRKVNNPRLSGTFYLDSVRSCRNWRVGRTTCALGCGLFWFAIKVLGGRGIITHNEELDHGILVKHKLPDALFICLDVIDCVALVVGVHVLGEAAFGAAVASHATRSRLVMLTAVTSHATRSGLMMLAAVTSHAVVVAHRSGVIAHVVVAAVSFTVFLVADKVGCEQWSALPRKVNNPRLSGTFYLDSVRSCRNWRVGRTTCALGCGLFWFAIKVLGGRGIITHNEELDHGILVKHKLPDALFICLDVIDCVALVVGVHVLGEAAFGAAVTSHATRSGLVMLTAVTSHAT